jgi:hypothetical protein
MTGVGRSHLRFLNQLRTLLLDFYDSKNKVGMNLAKDALESFLTGREWKEEELMVLRVRLWKEVNDRAAATKGNLIFHLAKKADHMYAKLFPKH